MTNLKNFIESFNSRFDQTEERITELKDKSFEIAQRKNGKKKKERKRVKKAYRNFRTPSCKPMYA